MLLASGRISEGLLHIGHLVELGKALHGFELLNKRGQRLFCGRDVSVL